MEATLQIMNEGLVTASDVLQLQLGLSEPVKGEARLRITWTDSYGRTVADELRTIYTEGSLVSFELPLERTLSILNYLEVQLAAGMTVHTAPKTEFIVTPARNKLDDYNIILYYPYKPEHQARLRDIGITDGKVSPGGRRLERPIVADPEKARIWLDNNYGYYCDQTAVPYYAAYHTPALEPKHKLLIEAKELYKKDRTSKEAFIRHPSFHDEEATADALERIRLTVEKHKQFKPIMYTTDECGVADLLTAWDFDFDPRALAAMRTWLMEQYGSLEAINEEWGTNFNTLEEVVPLTTDEMLERTDFNLSPWADHRFFMNKTFANAVDKGRKAAHSEDPEALSGIVGGQAPSTFGGYDYWLLSRSMDVMEPYNIGNNREILRSLSPQLPCFTTFFRYGDMEIWRLWHQVLHGDCGIIIYNDKTNDYMDEEGNFTETALGFKPHFKELTSGIVKQLLNGRAPESQVAIHYSQRSMTAHWRLEAEPVGKNWLNRGSYNEYKDAPFLRLRESYVRIAEDNHTDYDFVAYGQLENGEFDSMDRKVLLLPQSVALSPEELASIRRFVEKGGTLVADCLIGLMDGHCKLLDKGQLDDLFGLERSEVSFFPQPGPEGLEPALRNLPEELSWAAPFAFDRLEKVQTAEPVIRPASGAAALYKDNNGVPAVIVNNYGAGRTIYLNFLATDYHRWRLKPPEHESLRIFMDNLFKASGVTRACTVTLPDGSHPHAVEQFAFNYGHVKLIAFLKNYQNRVSDLGPPEYQDQSFLQSDTGLVVDLEEEKAVYDVRKGKYLGSMQKAEVTLAKWEPVILAVMDQPAEGISVSSPDMTERGTLTEIKICIKGPAVGDFHTFRTAVTDPSGNEMEHFAMNLSAPGGCAVWKLPFAASDRPGEYTLSVRDIATGLSAEKTINIL